MLDIKEIEKILPHRYPFLLIDKILEVEPLKSAVGIKNFTYNEQFFQGHFPNEPVVPGVLIIEALAQVGAVALLSSESFKGKTAYFGGIKKARFRKKVVPGDTLKLQVEILNLKGPAGIGKAEAYLGDTLVCEAELLFAIGGK